MSIIPLNPSTAQTLRDLQTDYEALMPDAQIIARQVVSQKQARGEPTPQAADLAAAITQISSDHMSGRSGAPTLVLTMYDPHWNLLDSGFFATDAAGSLGDLDLNYPEGGRWWWRLNQLSPQSDRTIQLTFIPRIVAEAMRHLGPVQGNRAKMTRAQFFKMLWGKVDDPQGIEFYSRQLDNQQPIGAVTTKSRASSSKAAAGKAAKSKGIGANAQSLTVKGSPINQTQIEKATLIVQVAGTLSAPDVAVRACVLAAIYESGIGMANGWDAGNPTYGGLLAGARSTFGSLGSAGSDAVAVAQIRSFMHGGNGYQGGGALKLAQKSSDVVYIASQVEAATPFDARGYSGQYAHENVGGYSFEKAVVEATNIVDAGGGAGAISAATTKTVTVDQPYYFKINKGEDYWTGMNRLAQEVNWELICDGNRVYFDSDRTLIDQKVAGVIDRDDPTTLQWKYDWENKHIATNFSVQVVTSLFEFCAGEVLLMTGFGAASTGSTAKLPGRWLISEVQRNSGDLFSTITLVQPTPAKPEPAPSTRTKTVKVGTVDSSAIVSGGFANPFPNGWTPNRLDMGYDGTFVKQIVAPFDGTIVYAARSWSNWGGFITIQAPRSIGLPTRTLYFAEGLFPTVTAGTKVKAGQQIAIAGTVGAQSGIPGVIEFGVADDGPVGSPVNTYCSTIGNNTPASRKMVIAFAAWVHDKLGVANPSDYSQAGGP